MQRNVAEEVRMRRTEYKSWSRKVRELVKDSKIRMDEDLIGS